MILRIRKTIERLYLFYSNAIRYRLKYRFNLLKYLQYIPIKFVYTSLFGYKAGKQAIKRYKILESYIIDKEGKRFHAINVNYFFEQFVHNIYERDKKFKIKKGMIVIDCGAAAGEYALLALEKGAKVISIESDKNTFNYLKENIGKYKDTKIINKAVSDKDSKETVKLDTLLKDIKKIDILKIDVEGHELHVLRGAKNTLNKTEKIIMEVDTPLLEKKCKALLQKRFDINIQKEKEDSLPVFFATKRK